ncbi:MAG: hypothetical protein AB7S38_32775 [Vulcanimicrobiota bacterium]
MRLGLQSLSLEMGRKVEFGEAIALLFAERLQTRPVSEEDLERMRAQAIRVLASRERRLEKPLTVARELAAERGLGPTRDEELFEATTAFAREDCPDAEAQLVRRAKPHWRLAFNPGARGLTPAKPSILRFATATAARSRLSQPKGVPPAAA